MVVATRRDSARAAAGTGPANLKKEASTESTLSGDDTEAVPASEDASDSIATINQLTPARVSSQEARVSSCRSLHAVLRTNVSLLQRRPRCS